MTVHAAAGKRRLNIVAVQRVPKPLACDVAQQHAHVLGLRRKQIGHRVNSRAEQFAFHARTEPRADHAQDLDHWLGVMRADKKAIFTATSKASEAATFLAALQGA
jgi:antirestriction protein ArdC